jgi:D-sedoheptulose 7-phosphate isomerase
VTPDVPLKDAMTPVLLVPETGTAAGPARLTRADSVAAVHSHLDNVLPAFESLRSQSFHLAAWGEELARRLLRG